MLPMGFELNILFPSVLPQLVSARLSHASVTMSHQTAKNSRVLYKIYAHLIVNNHECNINTHSHLSLSLGNEWYSNLAWSAFHFSTDTIWKCWKFAEWTDVMQTTQPAPSIILVKNLSDHHRFPASIPVFRMSLEYTSVARDSCCFDTKKGGKPTSSLFKVSIKSRLSWCSLNRLWG